MFRFNKYNNKKTTIDGITFDSKKEADRYCELKLLENAGHIKNLRLQPKYELIPKYEINGRKVRAMYYIADFEYEEVTTGEKVIEDVKGVKTAVYRLKKKLFEYQYQREIREI